MVSISANVLDHHGPEVVRAVYIKEVALGADPDKEITFGDDPVRLGDVQDWLSARARAESRRITVAAYAAVAAAALSFSSLAVGILVLFVTLFQTE